MTTYLTIITTVLVLTQIIRVTQNTIMLLHQERKIDKTLKWISDNDVSERDFEIQREVFHMLYEKLKNENRDDESDDRR